MRHKLFWTAACLATAFAVYFLANLPTLYERVKLDRSRPALSRYIFERTPDIVLVGTSMTLRISEGYFSIPLRNVAISGGSSLTGLSIIASYQSLPSLILVEVNVMSWGVDPVFVEQFGNNDAEPYRWFRPARALISYVYYWIKYKSEADNIARLPLLKPSEYEISDELNAVQKEYDNPSFDKLIRLDIDTLKQLVTSLERRGSKVLFYELPYPGKLGESRYATTARDLAHNAFPPEKWLKLRFPEGQLRWTDGAHLDPRSAIIVAKEIESAIR